MSTDYTAEELANATPEEWEDILDDFDIGSDYEQYFVQFDQQEIDDITANYQNQMAQLSLKSKSIAENLGNTYAQKQEETVGAVQDIGIKTADVVSHRGFETGGDITQRFGREKEKLVAGAELQVSAAGDTARLEQQSVALDKEAAGIQKGQETRSAYKAYQDQFYDQMAMVEGLKDDDDDDNSCFIAGTKVLMSNDSLKNIEDIQVGEFVKGMSGDNEVLALDRTVLGKRRLYSINGGNYFVTAEHPFMTKDGWKSIDANATLKENHLAFSDESSMGTLDVGDILITSGDEVEIESISLKSGDSQMQLYNFALSGDHTYNADGYLVHNKCCFIVLEVENKEKLDVYIRKYRDEMLNDTNRKGYYKLAQVVVPLMRKYNIVKWLFKYSFVSPAKSWAKTYYTGKGIGWVFEPLRKFWLGLFNYLGKDHEMKIDNG